jgi:sirohydrochlorin ferrochelatase
MKTLLAHGSSDSRHEKQAQLLADNVSVLLGEEVSLAFLNDEKLPDGATVLPLFLGEGKYVREDIQQQGQAEGSELDSWILSPFFVSFFQQVFVKFLT